MGNLSFENIQQEGLNNLQENPNTMSFEQWLATQLTPSQRAAKFPYFITGEINTSNMTPDQRREYRQWKQKYKQEQQKSQGASKESAQPKVVPDIKAQKPPVLNSPKVESKPEKHISKQTQEANQRPKKPAPNVADQTKKVIQPKPPVQSSLGDPKKEKAEESKIHENIPLPLPQADTIKQYDESRFKPNASPSQITAAKRREQMGMSPRPTDPQSLEQSRKTQTLQEEHNAAETKKPEDVKRPPVDEYGTQSKDSIQQDQRQEAIKQALNKEGNYLANPNKANLKDVDPRMVLVANEGARLFEQANPDYDVEIYGPHSGFRTSGSVHNHGAQPDTGLGGAIDVQIYDRKNQRYLTNFGPRGGGKTAHLYQQWANYSKAAQEKMYPDMPIRWGGYFGTGDTAADFMHIDRTLGKDGKIAPTSGGGWTEGFTPEQMRKYGIGKNIGMGNIKKFTEEAYGDDKNAAEAPTLQEQQQNIAPNDTSDAAAIQREADGLGITAEDLGAVINYETDGEMNPGKWGGKNNNYLGLIQFGPTERKKYGVNENQTFAEQMPAVGQFLKDRGLKRWLEEHPDATQREKRIALYSTINAGSPDEYEKNGKRRWSRSDNNGKDTVETHADRIFNENGRFLQASRQILQPQQDLGSTDSFIEQAMPKTEEPQQQVAEQQPEQPQPEQQPQQQTAILDNEYGTQSKDSIQQEQQQQIAENTATPEEPKPLESATIKFGATQLEQRLKNTMKKYPDIKYNRNKDGTYTFTGPDLNKAIEEQRQQIRDYMKENPFIASMSPSAEELIKTIKKPTPLKPKAEEAQKPIIKPQAPVQATTVPTPKAPEAPKAAPEAPAIEAPKIEQPKQTAPEAPKKPAIEELGPDLDALGITPMATGGSFDVGGHDGPALITPLKKGSKAKIVGEAGREKITVQPQEKYRTDAATIRPSFVPDPTTAMPERPDPQPQQQQMQTNQASMKSDNSPVSNPSFDTNIRNINIITPTMPISYISAMNRAKGMDADVTTNRYGLFYAYGKG